MLTESEIKDPYTEFLLLTAARRDHVQNLILPSLSNGYTVICDRFFDSSLAYQGYQKGLDIKKMQDIHMQAVGLMPHITFLLDVKLHTISERLEGRAEINHYDEKSFDFHLQIKEAFLRIAQFYKQRIYVVNADQDELSITKQMLHYMLDLLQ